MATFLINATNLKVGGGLQVADSICCQLHRSTEHRFIVVLSSALATTKERMVDSERIRVYSHDITNDWRTVLFGRDEFLDGLVENHHVEAVLTVFGPSRWNPRVKHLSGWAIPHPLILESPYFRIISVKNKLKFKVLNRAWLHFFRRSADYFWTENPYISARVEQLMPEKKVFTVTNYYNQLLDNPVKWTHNVTLPAFEGTTCLSVSSYYEHKNFGMLPRVAHILKRQHPEFKFRFVLTFKKEYLAVPEDIKDCFLFIGKVDVAECPHLYQKADIMLMPTLLECFTATYPEAMRMEVPIVTTDLEFAQGLCGDAACYYSAVDAVAAAEAIYKVATEEKYAAQLVANGKEQLKKFDNYEQRADKLIGILEEIVQK